MNRPIPSLLLSLWQNESLCETIGMKICHLYSHSHENSDFHDFHGKRFAQVLALQMETQTVEVKVCKHSFFVL